MPITSRYLQTIGAGEEDTGESLSVSDSESNHGSPLRDSSNLNNTLSTSPFAKTTKSSPCKKHHGDEENMSPIRRLIKEKEEAVRLNASLGQSMPLPGSSSTRISKSPTKIKLNSSIGHGNAMAAPKLSYKKPSLKSASEKAKEDRTTLNRIVSGMTQSPSMKNLNKLKSIETKINSSRSKVSTTTKKRPSSPKKSNSTIDRGRKSMNTYEYLCRVTEAKRWLEKTLNIKLDQNHEDEKAVIVDFASYLRNGIILAEVAQKFCPAAVKKIYYGSSASSSAADYRSQSGFQFKYTENINYFFQMLENIKLPTDYRFELTDLYDLKNFPKVIFCIHALAYMLAIQKKSSKMSMASDEIEFNEQEISKTESNIRGLKIPNFDNFDDIEGDESDDEYQDEDTSEHEYEEHNTIHPDLVEQSDDDEYENNRIAAGSGGELFDSDTEATSDDAASMGELTAVGKDLSLNSFGYDNVEDIHKKYESLISQDSFTYSSGFFSSSYKSRYHPSNEHHGEEIALYLETIINIQSISRGSLVRYQMFVDKFMLKSCRDKIIEFQGILRGHLARNKSPESRKQISFPSRGMRKLQSFVKFNESDEKFFRINGALLFHKDNITEFQSILRGYTTRRRIMSLRKELTKATNSIIHLQSNIRYKNIKGVTCLEVDQVKMITPSVTKLQSVLRRKLFNQTTRRSLTRVYSADEATVMIQSMARGNKVRKMYQAIPKTLNRDLASIVEIQSIVRGGSSRAKLNDVLDTLYYEDAKLVEFASVARGQLLRKHLKKQKRKLLGEINSIIAVQSCFRGVLSRFEQDSLLDDIEDNYEPILELQSIVRGQNLRRSFDERWIYYNKPQNLQKVIKIQRFIQTKKQGDAYKLLTSMTNPPLPAVKKFIGLLNDNEVDFDQEINLAKTKDSIKKANTSILKLEDALDHLDLKIEQLMKNKISIDDLAAAASLGNSHTKMDDPKSASAFTTGTKTYAKPLRERVEVYQKLIYLLQVKPVYFIRIFEVIEKHKLHYDLGLHDNIEDFILKLFGYSLHQENKKLKSREEYLVTNLILSAIYHQIDELKTIEDYKSWNKTELTFKDLTKLQYSWELLLMNFNNLVEQRTALKDLLARNVESILIDEKVDLESHPIAIYRSIIEDNERKSQRPSLKPVNITPQEAIQDTETREKFVENLGQLREITNDFLLAIESNIGKLPIHIRIICSEVYKHSTKNYSKEFDRFHLAIVGKLFMKYYILPILLTPENYALSILDSMVNERLKLKAKKNLLEVAKVLFQLVSMRSFSAKNVYLQPLNDYIEQSVELVRRILRRLIDVRDIDTVYNMSLYDDITCDKKPTVTVTTSDCYSLTHMLTKEIDVVAPSRNDLLRNLISSLTSMGDHGFRNLDSITLELTPLVDENDDSEMSIEAKTLCLQVKRCILYAIQVQDGDNLVDILVSHIEPEHETLFKNIIKQEKKDLTKNVQKPYSGNGLTIQTYDTETGETKSVDLTKITYHELKKITLEKLLQLEAMGEVTRQDGFQKLLNEITSDIKGKHSHRLKLRRDYDKAQESLAKLKFREKDLQDQLDNYNKEIEDAIMSLHSSTSKKKNFFSKIFSRQFFYHRELKKKGRLPMFGSYKYSAKHLYDNGVLLEVNGMTLIEYELSASGSSKVPKLDFSFSCDKVGVFQIEMRQGLNVMGGAYEKLTLDKLLQYQYNNEKEISMFKGVAKFDCNALIALIFKKFYDK